MKAPHVHIAGRCLACGFREPGPRANAGLPGPEGVAPDHVAVAEEFNDDCPHMRFYLVRILVCLVPVLFMIFGWEITLIAMIMGGVLFRFGLTPQNDRWFGLRNVQEEYYSLLDSVQSRKRNFFVNQLEGALQPLFSQRDRAFRAQSALGGDTLDEVEFKIEQIRAKSQHLTDPAMIEMYRAQLKDLNENKKKLEQLQGFLTKFEISRNSVAESIRLLRNRMLITEAGDDDAEDLRIMEDLKSLHQIYERVNLVPGSALTPPSAPEAEEPEDEEEPPPLPPQKLSE